tara:strand:- start:4627 stop:5070 length:444 start_codon:yes stop_codon:yes gene_type:complete
VSDPFNLNNQAFSGQGWQTGRSETATILGVTDRMVALADEARHDGPRVLAVNMAEIARLHPRLKDSFQRFADSIGAESDEALADGDGDNRPLMAAKDAVTIIGVVAQNMITRDGVQQVQDNLTSLRDAIITMDQAVKSPDLTVSRRG